MPDAEMHRLLDALTEALLGESPRTEVRGIVETARARDLLPAATLERFAATSDTLHRARQRQDLLQALVAVTRELTSIRGLGETMSMLVRMTRSLLRSDMAYLSLNDTETDTTYIRETDGVISEGYRNIRMPFGAGILGSVAAANGPFQTRDYLADPSVRSDPDTRRRVAEEGVRGIVGAPVRLGGRIIGALLVADRSVREYEPSEVAVLESLATHAAAVLENARLFEELEANLTRAEEARAEAGRHVAELTRLGEAEAELMAALGRLAGPDEFAAALGGLLGEPAIAVEIEHLHAVLGSAVRAVAVTEATRRLEAAAPVGALVEVAEGRRDPEAPGRDGAGAPALVLVPVAVGSRLLGAVGMRGAPTSTQRLVLQRAAVAFGALLSFQKALEASGAREQSELVDALVGGRPAAEHAALLRRAGDFGLDLAAPVVAVIVEPVVPRLRAMAVLAAEMVVDRGVTAVRDGRILALVNAESAEELAIDWARRFAARGMNATVAAEATADGLPGGAQARGGAGPEGRLAAIPEAHRSAAAVLAAALQLGRRGEPCTRAMLGVAALVIGGDRDGVTRSIVRYAIGPLIDYDEQRGTSLAETALGFLDGNQRVSACARQLHLHENTVRQRLTRIDDLLGVEWRQGTKCLDVHLALRVHQLSRSDNHMI
ncbi:helix-turn-helix domain-containing protein [Leucobacter sp. CSA1]|uniref:Helix-turn-helix domain-containing protein n=1 Tax=Leucobacter chromiisoli TaxID=2796471 RepID=A0A934Q6J9_9MICO|nr:helix-turn-helix domain-containing protein [Leucobacter chromiisoli]MBK0417517.1 helix-turn-helix domain-containing protein [Leucobacter chromiisoli]